MTDEERGEVLSLYADLRVADVRDGMDAMMMHGRGSVSPSIRPVFRTRAFGIARTCRYLPYAGTVPEMPPEKYKEWAGWYYKQILSKVI